MSFEFKLAKPVLAQASNAANCGGCQSICSNDAFSADCTSCLSLCSNSTGNGGGGSGKFDIVVQEPENLPQPLKDVGGIISTIVGAAILISAIAAFLYLIWGGLQWITSGGDKSALETARGRITAAIIGLVIVGAAWGIFKIIETIFGFTTILGGGS